MTDKITVSDLFIEIYQDLNVYHQIDKMKMLNRKELMLLLILSIDLFEVDDDMAIYNISEFEDELKIINENMNVESLDNDIIALIDDTGHRFIDTGKIRDKEGRVLTRPLTKEEAIIKRREI